VASGSLNWNNRPVSTGSPSRGNNLALSYRHGMQNGATNAHDNRGRINTVFFDGSVRSLNDQKSRDPIMWYPRGTVVKAPISELMLETFVPDDRIP
jgi:prepilin-type processing-associated H-X9-DG protein